MNWAKLIPLVFALAMFRSHSIAVKVNKHSMMVGDKITVTCVVDRHDSNRWLDLGLEDDEHVVLDHSTIQLDGNDSPRIFNRDFRGQCDAVAAYCIVSDSQGPQDRATATIQVECGDEIPTRR